MRQTVKDRLNRKLNANDMTQLSVEPTQQRLYRNRAYNSSECQNRLINNIDNENIPYGHGQYDDRQHSNYSTLQETTTPTFLQSITPGNEQLLIIGIFGVVAYALYLFSKSKDKSCDKS